MEHLSSERPSTTTIAVDNSLIFLTVVVITRGPFCYLYDTKARTHIFYSSYLLLSPPVPVTTFLQHFTSMLDVYAGTYVGLLNVYTTTGTPP
jgi:hypothetical protein